MLEGTQGDYFEKRAHAHHAPGLPDRTDGIQKLQSLGHRRLRGTHRQDVRGGPMPQRGKIPENLKRIRKICQMLQEASCSEGEIPASTCGQRLDAVAAARAAAMRRQVGETSKKVKKAQAFQTQIKDAVFAALDEAEKTPELAKTDEHYHWKKACDAAFAVAGLIYPDNDAMKKEARKLAVDFFHAYWEPADADADADADAGA